MARRKRYAGTKAQHRGDAGFNAKEARRFAQKARAAARRGDCATALHLFGVTAFHAGLAAGARKWAGGRGHRGGSRMGARTHDLQKSIFRACRIER